MSKSLTYSELEKSGLKLTQMEAQSIHSRINEIAQGRHETGEVFEKPAHAEIKKANTVKESTGFTPVSDKVIVIEYDPSENNIDDSNNLPEIPEVTEVKPEAKKPGPKPKAK